MFEFSGVFVGLWVFCVGERVVEGVDFVKWMMDVESWCCGGDGW